MNVRNDNIRKGALSLQGNKLWEGRYMEELIEDLMSKVC